MDDPQLSQRHQPTHDTILAAFRCAPPGPSGGVSCGVIPYR